MTRTNTPQRTYWNVSFSDTWATITTTVSAISDDDAIALAANFICDYYNIDVDRWSAEADDTNQPADKDSWL